MALLTVKGLGKAWGNNWVVSDLSFSSEPLEQVAIVGETGSGKTSLLKMLGGLMQPDAGSIFLGEEKIKGPDEVLIPGHKKIGYLSQHFELRNNYRVHEVLEMASRMEQEAADKILQVCKVDHLLQRWTDELSGGEKQRIALARILLAAPRLLLLDEPFSNLDAAHKKLMQKVLKELGHQLQISCVMVSHDATDILSWAQTVLVMHQGKLLQKGSPQEIYHQPLNEYVAALTGEHNLIIPGHPLYEATMNTSAAGKNLFLRPQQVKLFPASHYPLQGIVQQVNFMGSHYAFQIQMGETIVLANMQEAAYAVGDEVSLSVAVRGN